MGRAPALGIRRRIPGKGHRVPGRHGRAWPLQSTLPPMRRKDPAHPLRRQRNQLLRELPDRRKTAGRSLPLAPPPPGLAPNPGRAGVAYNQEMLKHVAAAVLLSATGFCQQHTHTSEAQDNGPAPLLDWLGHLHHPITTSKPEAQRYFDQGLTLVYGFNYDEAARSFRYAAKLDPKCAMAYWGVALAVGPNYNDPDIDAARRKSAHETSQKA